MVGEASPKSDKSSGPAEIDIKLQDSNTEMLRLKQNQEIAHVKLFEPNDANEGAVEVVQSPRFEVATDEECEGSKESNDNIMSEGLDEESSLMDDDEA